LLRRFLPIQIPPPDDPAAHQHISTPTSSSRISKAWFPAQPNTSYQSGGVPTFNTSSAGGQAVQEAVESQTNQWETRFGLRVDALSALAYLLGPISALLLLILETHNDYVRFHAYQSGLLSGPLLLLRLLLSLLRFPQFFKVIINVVIVASSLFMAAKAFIDADRNGLARFQLPYIGALAERWVTEE